MSLKNRQLYGYNHLETDTEVVDRLKKEGSWSKMRIRGPEETFDAWLDAHNQTRKWAYVSQ